jgi:LPXTG-motif cell wall-anchored protein
MFLHHRALTGSAIEIGSGDSGITLFLVGLALIVLAASILYYFTNKRK